MLAAAMGLIHRAGGVYATCDTDSVFPVATETGDRSPVRAAVSAPRRGRTRSRR